MRLPDLRLPVTLKTAISAIIFIIIILDYVHECLCVCMYIYIYAYVQVCLFVCVCCIVCKNVCVLVQDILFHFPCIYMDGSEGKAFTIDRPCFALNFAVAWKFVLIIVSYIS